MTAPDLIINRNPASVLIAGGTERGSQWLVENVSEAVADSDGVYVCSFSQADDIEKRAKAAGLNTEQRDD